MNFYASDVYLETLANVYFSGKPTRIEDIEVHGEVYRLLVVGGRRVITSWYFMDYLEPLPRTQARAPKKRSLFLDNVVRETVTIEQWQLPEFARSGRPAPFVDFTGFGSYADYRAH